MLGPTPEFLIQGVLCGSGVADVAGELLISYIPHTQVFISLANNLYALKHKNPHFRQQQAIGFSFRLSPTKSFLMELDSEPSEVSYRLTLSLAQ